MTATTNLLQATSRAWDSPRTYTAAISTSRQFRTSSRRCQGPLTTRNMLCGCLSGTGAAPWPLCCCLKTQRFAVPARFYRTHSGKPICWLSIGHVTLLDRQLFGTKNEASLQLWVIAPRCSWLAAARWLTPHVTHDGRQSGGTSPTWAAPSMIKLMKPERRQTSPRRNWTLKAPARLGDSLQRHCVLAGQVPPGTEDLPTGSARRCATGKVVHNELTCENLPLLASPITTRFDYYQRQGSHA